jgi:fibronectin-binding autotransporter adhesin
MKTSQNIGAPHVRAALSIPAGISFLGCSLVSILASTSLNAQINVTSGQTYVINSDAQLGTDNITVASGGAAQLVDGVTVIGNDIAIVGSGVGYTGALNLASGATAEWGGGVSLSTAANSRIGNTSGGQLTVSGNITGGAGRTLELRANNGTIVLSGDNNYDANTSVTASGNTTRVVVSSNSAFGSTVGTTTQAKTGTSVQLTDGITIAGETILIRGSGTSTEGALTTTANSSAAWNGPITLSSAENARISAGNNGTMSIGGVISGTTSGRILEIRPSLSGGRVVFTGSNLYTVPTDVLGGEFFVNGDNSAATGLMTVGTASAATLGGSGIIGANTIITADGTLAPGDGLGSLTFNGDLTLQAGANISFELLNSSSAGVSYDQIVGDTLILPGAGSITLTISGLDEHTIVGGDSFTIFTGTLTNFDVNNITIVNNTDWTGGWELSEGSLVLTAIPEPSSFALILGMLGLGLIGVARRPRGNRC